MSLDNGVVEFFHEENDKTKDGEENEAVVNTDSKMEVVMYDDIVCHQFLWQDDVLSLSNSIKSAQETNNKMERLMESKCLDLHPLKSCFLIYGNTKSRRKLQQRIDKEPILLYGKKMKQVSVEKYLGCQLGATAATSVSATVSKRMGVVTRAIYDARAVVEDSRAKAVGGIVVMFNIWELAICSTLYYGCENWTSLPKKTLNQLN